MRNIMLNLLIGMSIVLNLFAYYINSKLSGMVAVQEQDIRATKLQLDVARSFL